MRSEVKSVVTGGSSLLQDSPRATRGKHVLQVAEGGPVVKELALRPPCPLSLLGACVAGCHAIYGGACLMIERRVAAGGQQAADGSMIEAAGEQ